MTRRIILVCSGAVPQHPPMILTVRYFPVISAIAPAIISGVMPYVARPFSSSGSPALGTTSIGRAAFRSSHSMAGTISAGPVEQFIPKTSTPMPSIATYAASTGAPSSIFPYCGKATLATTGRPLGFAAETARFISGRSLLLSTSMASA